MFKCFVNEHDNDCKDCFRVVNWVDSDEKWFRFAVELNDEFISRDIIEWNVDVDVQFFEKLSDEIFILIIFELNDELFQTTFKSLTRFSFEIAIRKAFFEVIAFLFRIIRWSAVEFITYETLFRNANRKSVARSRINKKSTIVTIIVEFAMILFVDEVVIMNMITIVDVNALKIRVILFID